MCLVTSPGSPTKQHSNSMNQKSKRKGSRTRGRSPPRDVNGRARATSTRDSTGSSGACSGRNARLRVWLVLLAASCWSMYSLHKTVGSHGSELQKMEGQMLAEMFRVTAREAAEALHLSGRDSSPTTKNDGYYDVLPAQRRREVQAMESSNNQYSSNGVDFSNLKADHHHAIVIPYRDRKFHLEQFIEHMGPYLRRNFPKDTFELWIVEQDDSFLFNRAWLGNVGIANIKQQNRQHRFEELKAQQAKANGNVNLTVSVPPPPRCIILHDVDLIPTVDGVPYTNCSRPIQLGSELAHFNYSIPYPLYTGGVGPSMTLEHWTKINGMSNDFYGWGGEDDELWHRLRLTGLLKKPAPRPIPPPGPDGKPYKGPKFWPPEIVRPPKGRGRFRPISEAQTVHHNHKGHNQWNRIGYMLELMQNNSARWKKDGLSDMRMTITGDATTITHMDSIELNNATLHEETDRSVMDRAQSTTTTITKKHYISAKQPGSLVSSLSVDPVALASFAAIHHVKAIPKITPLEFLHITQNDGGRIERAGASAGVPWGACHYHHALEKAMHCPDIAMPELEGNTPMRPERASQTPWHSPLQDFLKNPYRGRPTFAVVRNPYERLIGFFYCPWNGYKGKAPDDPKSLNEFIQEALFPKPRPTEAPKTGTPPPVAPIKPAAMLHLRPQYHYIFATNEIMAHSRPFVTHVLHYENLQEDFLNLMKMYGMEEKIKLPSDRLQAATERPRTLSVEDFDDATLRMIHRFYGRDFNRFGYKKKYVKPEPTKAPTVAPTTQAVVEAKVEQAAKVEEHVEAFKVHAATV